MACLKVIKDYKAICLNQYIELALGLHYSGQVYLNTSNRFDYLIERNNDIYLLFKEVSHKPFTLKTLCTIVLRNAIKNYGANKLSKLNIPHSLKEEMYSNGFYLKRDLNIFNNQNNNNNNFRKNFFYIF